MWVDYVKEDSFWKVQFLTFSFYQCDFTEIADMHLFCNLCGLIYGKEGCIDSSDVEKVKFLKSKNFSF